MLEDQGQGQSVDLIHIGKHHPLSSLMTGCGAMVQVLSVNPRDDVFSVLRVGCSLCIMSENTLFLDFVKK